MNIYSTLSRRYGPPLDPISRRAFIRATLLAGAGLLLSRYELSAATDSKKHTKPKRVIIVGAGLAGLSCAYELLAAGFDVNIIEARSTFGGRVQTFTDLIPGKTIEAGGEFIGANHPTWLAYAKKFQLKLVDASDDQPKSEIPLVINGRRLTRKEEKAVWEEMQFALKLMNRDATMVNADMPWKSNRAEQFDQRTTQNWLETINLSDFGRAAVTAQLENDNGVPLSRQSYLGNLALVRGGGMEKYWTETESLRCVGGNQQLTSKFVDAIGSQRFHYGEVVREIALSRPYVRVITHSKTYEGDFVVLAVPPSVWPTIQFIPPLPSALHPQMGTAVKYLSVVKEPFWKKNEKSADSLGNDFVGWTWNATARQTGRKEVCLTSFAGGPDANDACDIPADSRKRTYTAHIKKRYEHYPANLVNTRFVDWQNEPFTRGGYSFPAPRQITQIGAFLQKPLADSLYFAGEHTCYKFAGYMEGALQSGVAAARRIVRRVTGPEPQTVPPKSAQK